MSFWLPNQSADETEQYRVKWLRRIYFSYDGFIAHLLRIFPMGNRKQMFQRLFLLNSLKSVVQFGPNCLRQDHNRFSAYEQSPCFSMQIRQLCSVPKARRHSVLV